MNMEYVIKNREPADALRFFEEISAIPRGSKNEKGIAEYLMNFAKSRGLWAHVDDLYNVYIKKPGTPGCETLPPVLLQGHTDIVCEKNRDVDHDFEKDPLKLVVEGNIVRADGTTLGADNGIAVAYMLAILDRDNLKHPPLECVFTSQEEIGLVGARGLDPGLIDARKMINMDTAVEGTMIINCADGQKVVLRKDFTRVPFEGTALALSVRGLFGGHSGLEIHLERGNSNKLMGRALHNIAKEMEVGIVSIEGGDKENAIPRECDCVIAVKDPARAKEIVEELAATYKNEYEFSDPGVRLEVKEVSGCETMACPADSRAFIHLLYLLPCGPIATSLEFPGLVTTSSSLGVLRTEGDTFVIRNSLRTVEPTRCWDTSEQMALLAETFGAAVERNQPGVGWIRDKVSPFRDLCLEIYREMYGEDMIVTGIHGGLECGVLKAMIPDMEIVAFGANDLHPHTPEECMELDSFERVFGYVLKILERLAS